MMRRTLLFLLFLLSILPATAQISSMPFSKVEIRIDTLTFDSKNNLVTVNKEPRLFFKYRDEEEVCEVRLYASDLSSLSNLKLVPSADFEMLDSMVRFNDEFIQFRVRFLHLSASDYLNFTFSFLPVSKSLMDTSDDCCASFTLDT